MIKHAWLRHVLFRYRIPYSLWHKTVTSIPVLRRLSHREQHRLRKLTTLFLHAKTISGADGFVVDDNVRITIGAQACLLILNLGIGSYAGWREIIVYPHTFIVKRDEPDACGLVVESRHSLSGESWHRGPVVLSWEATSQDAQPRRFAHNLILHEFAHKLDMLNGSANGMPPLHPSMPLPDWTSSLSEAFASLNQQIDTHRSTPIDPYEARNPAEFFAVFTEVFFEQPAQLHVWYPEVYRQLSLYYRQDPAGLKQ